MKDRKKKKKKKKLTKLQEEYKDVKDIKKHLRQKVRHKVFMVYKEVDFFHRYWKVPLVNLF